MTVFMTLYGHIPYKKTLDKRKNCTRELFSVALTKISHKKTLKAVLCSVNYFCQKKRTCVKVPLRLGLKVLA